MHGLPFCQRLLALPRRADGRQDGASPRGWNVGCLGHVGPLLSDRLADRLRILALARDAAAVALAGVAPSASPPFASGRPPRPPHSRLEPANHGKSCPV